MRHPRWHFTFSRYWTAFQYLTEPIKQFGWIIDEVRRARTVSTPCPWMVNTSLRAPISISRFSKTILPRYHGPPRTGGTILAKPVFTVLWSLSIPVMAKSPSLPPRYCEPSYQPNWTKKEDESRCRGSPSFFQSQNGHSQSPVFSELTGVLEPIDNKKGTLIKDSSFGGVYVTRTRDPLRDRQVF